MFAKKILFSQLMNLHEVIEEISLYQSLIGGEMAFVVVEIVAMVFVEMMQFVVNRETIHEVFQKYN
jgi:hypothetical protein